MASQVSQPAPSRPAGPPAPPARPPRPAAAMVAGLIEALPLLVPAAVAGFSLVTMILLLLGLFRPVLVLPLGLAGALVAARGVTLARPERLAGPGWVDGAALLAALGFAAFNARFAAQNVNVFRDPATYTITGRWLAEHGSLPVPVRPEVFGAVEGLSFASLGFDASTTPGFVHPQFSNLVPGLLGVGGWLGGDGLLLRVNVLVGAAALLAFYGLARQLTRREWALAATLALGASLPLLYFSRNTSSEPATLLFLVGGLALLREAQRRGRAPAYALAGLVLGSAALARVDAYFYLLTVPLFALVILAAAPAAERRRVAGQVGALALGAALPAGVALANLASLSPVYLRDRGPEVRVIAVAGVAVVVVGAAAVAVAWRTRLLHLLGARSARWLPIAAAGAVAVLAAVGGSRPLWYVGHAADPDASQPGYVAFLQRAYGLRVDPTRNYAEQTLAWLTWYWGPLTVALGVLGAVVGVYWLLRRGDLRLVAPLAMFLSAALLYLTLPHATPDQVNVMRRYLPVVIPGVLLAAAVALGVLARRHRVATWAAAALAVAMVAFPARVSAPVATVRDGVPQLAEVTNLCDHLPPDAALLVTGSLADTYQQTARSWCGVPVAGLREPTSDRLDEVEAAARAHGRRLHVVVTDPGALPDDAVAAPAEWRPVSCIRASHLSAVLERPPEGGGATERSMFVGVATASGTLRPAPVIQPPPLLDC